MTGHRPEADSSARHRVSNALKSSALFTLICLLLFALLEGMASTALFTRHLLFRARGTLPSRVHVQYDSLLGWVNTPGTEIDDMYGPGLALIINRRGFRDTRPDGTGPAGQGPALICSGDSFTLGVGVAAEKTWCHLIATHHHLEYANLGHAGYGIGQTYLRYQREAADLPRGIHVVAFITDDFPRTVINRFVGYAKPRVELEDGRLITTGVPVPRQSGFGPWLAMHGEIFLELRTVDMAGRLEVRFDHPPAGWIGDRARGPALAMFETLFRENQARGTQTVFVFLKENRTINPRERDLSEWLTTELGNRDIPYVDLTRDFYRLPFEDLDAMYDPIWEHYSVAGNARVAEVLDAYLASMLASLEKDGL